MTGFCIRCGRELTNPKSVERGMGDVCALKSLHDSDPGCGNQPVEEFIVTDFDGVVCERRTVSVGALGFEHEVPATNIPRVLEAHSPDGFEWGYGGSGPADFALNILVHFGASVEFAERHHHEFLWGFIAGLPEEGGLIPGDVVRSWVVEKKARDDEAVAV